MDSLSTIKWRMPLHSAESIQRASHTNRSPGWYRKGVDIVVITAALAMVTFSMPYREGGGIDPIGIMKFGLRTFALGWFGVEALFVLNRHFRNWASSRGRRLASNLPAQIAPRNRFSQFAHWLITGDWRSPVLLPWICFAGWSTLSIIWSPLKVFSFGQWVGLAAMLLISHSIASRYRSAFRQQTNQLTNEVSDWRPLFTALQLMLSAYCLMVVLFYCYSPEASGLRRDVLYAGVAGLVHPTAAGATSALAILMGALAVLLRLTRYRWLILMTMPVNAALLLLSNSRTSMLMLFTSLSIAVVFLSTRAQKGICLAAAGFLLLSAMTLSPGSQWLGNQVETVSDYLMRGQSTDDLKQVSGRSEMWTAIWKEYKHSPLIGHGYYVTSRSGELYVWGRVDNHDAHNIFLQSLASGGIIGGCLLLWALLGMAVSLWNSAARRISQMRRSIDLPRDDFLWCIGLVGLWYVGWSQTCTTFLGPIRPESVVFYVLLGLFAARQDARLHPGVSKL